MDTRWPVKGGPGPPWELQPFGSFIAGTLGIIGLMLAAPPLARMALKFGPQEYFSLVILGLTMLTFLARGAMWKSLIMAAVGIFLGCVGLDVMSGSERFTLNIMELADGIGIAPVAMGLFGISEVLLNIEQSERSVFKTKIKHLFPSLRDWAASICLFFEAASLVFSWASFPAEEP